MIHLIYAALGLLICACVLMAPHVSRSNGLRGSIAFSLMAGVSLAAFAVFATRWIAA